MSESIICVYSYCESKEILSKANWVHISHHFQDSFDDHRYLVMGKSKDGYYGLLFEKFNDADEGIDSIYNYSSVKPDDLYGKLIGHFESLEALVAASNEFVTLDPNRYLISGQLDQVFHTKPGP